MLQSGVENHASNSKYHVRYVENTKSLLKPLPQCVYKANECQKNAWYIRKGVVEFCNIRRICIILLTALGCRRDRTPEARYSSLSHSRWSMLKLWKDWTNSLISVGCKQNRSSVCSFSNPKIQLDNVTMEKIIHEKIESTAEQSQVFLFRFVHVKNSFNLRSKCEKACIFAVQRWRKQAGAQGS